MAFKISEKWARELFELMKKGAKANSVPVADHTLSVLCKDDPVAQAHIGTVLQQSKTVEDAIAEIRRLDFLEVTGTDDSS